MNPIKVSDNFVAALTVPQIRWIIAENAPVWRNMTEVQKDRCLRQLEREAQSA